MSRFLIMLCFLVNYNLIFLIVLTVMGIHVEARESDDAVSGSIMERIIRDNTARRENNV